MMTSSMSYANIISAASSRWRLSMAYIGHPLLGDVVYGRKKQPYELKGQVDRKSVVRERV